MQIFRSSVLREQFIHTGPLTHILLFEENGENLDGWIELQHVGTAPALESGDADTWLKSH